MLPGSGGALYCSALAFTRPVGTVTNHRKARAAQSVSYTHLTLPTNREV